ncbi:hypothetical protein [Bacillus pseudomycoides]|nr:hypothetical protein [Bacillus pseudomycoides]
MRQENIPRTHAHSNEIDENPLGFFIGCRNAFILALPLWAIVYWVWSKI